MDETTIESEGFFDDFDSADAVEETPSTTEETEEIATTDKVDTTPTEAFLKIRYNKEDFDLTKEEAIELAQKGKNYDKVNDKYNSLSGQLDKLARMNGMSVDKYIESLNDTQMRFETTKEINALKQQYPNSDPKLLEEIAQQRVTQRLGEQIKKAEEAESEQADAQTLDLERQVSAFQRRYPNIDPQSVDDEVIDLMNEGYTMLEAYSIWASTQEAKPISTKEKNSALNQENKKRGLGNVGTTGNVDADDFLRGFLG